LAKIATGGKPAPSKAPNFPKLSASMYKQTLEAVNVVAKSGSSNFLQGYYHSNWVNDFLHSAGLITDQCYQDNRLFGDIFAGTSAAGDIVGSILGNGALAPTLRTKVEQSTETEGGGDEVSSAIAAANTQALASLIAGVETTIG